MVSVSISRLCNGQFCCASCCIRPLALCNICCPIMGRLTSRHLFVITSHFARGCTQSPGCAGEDCLYVHICSISILIIILWCYVQPYMVSVSPSCLGKDNHLERDRTSGALTHAHALMAGLLMGCIFPPCEVNSSCCHVCVRWSKDALLYVQRCIAV